MKHRKLLNSAPSERITRGRFPGCDELLEQGIVLANDAICFVGKPGNVSTLVDANQVHFAGERLTLNEFARRQSGWKSVNVYRHIIVVRLGVTLGALRAKLRPPGCTAIMGAAAQNTRATRTIVVNVTKGEGDDERVLSFPRRADIAASAYLQHGLAIDGTTIKIEVGPTFECDEDQPRRVRVGYCASGFKAEPTFEGAR